MKGDDRVRRAIVSSEKFLASKDPANDFNSYGGLTVQGCERRNLRYYRDMLGEDKSKFTGFWRELYRAI
jgi:hypothetical protein